MILRMVRGRVLPGRIDALREGIAAAYHPARRAQGVVSAHAALRATESGHEFALMSSWTTADAAIGAVGRRIDQLGTLPGVSEHIEADRIEHYEIDEVLLARSDRRPAIARIAAGSIELGSDAEIQQELRRRLPSLGDEVVEMQVGRRIRGGMVDVMFVTLWSHVPEGVDLQSPVFPDVADQYRDFWVEIYDELDPGVESAPGQGTGTTEK